MMVTYFETPSHIFEFPEEEPDEIIKGIKNSIVANNTGGDCDFQSPVNAGGENLDSDGSCTGFTIIADPLLGPLADNGGPTMTHALLPGSPAIGAGAGPCIGLDQRDVSRPSTDCDLGAYEDTSEIVQAPEPTPTDTSTPEPEIVDRCTMFDPSLITVTMFDIPHGSTTQTLYLFNPNGWPGVEFDVPEDPEPWEYGAALGSTTAQDCSYQGYDGRLYCTFVLPEAALGTLQELNVTLNLCINPIFTHPAVSIIEPEDSGGTSLTCSANLGKSDCIAAGGEYKDASQVVSPFCACP
jgi:hypothetical protein